MIINKFVRAVSVSFLLALFLLPTRVWANALESIRVWPSPDETRVVIDLASEAEYSYFTLSSPDRLVVDLKQTSINTKLPINVSESPVLKRIRKSSPPQKGTYRLVFELKRKVTPQLFKLAPTPGGQYGHRLVIDMPHGSSSSSTSAAKPSSSSSSPQVSRDASQLLGTADIVVAIDAGHGGEDPGSIGPSRKYEKHATLAISKKIAAQINAVPGMKAVLTRRGDYFVNLNKRSEIARGSKAHLLVSIHADGFRTPQPRGGSVFVLNTRRANSEIARWVENHEEQSQLLGGAGEVLSKNTSDKNVSQTLLDLQFSHSQKEGYKVATKILKQMSSAGIKLHKKQPVNASLAVLKSPDIPSVLVETGFITNPTEEKLLFQRSHQDKLARALTKAIVQYFEANPPEGTLFSNRGKTIKHKVKRGESLSVIAKKYGTTTKAIMQANKLKSSSLAIGQVLTIPGSKGAIPVPKVTNPVETKTITHVVQSGEYLGKIAARYKVSVATIKRENKLRSDTLKLGQKLKITVSMKDQPLRKHKVKRGEFLGKIASQYDVSVSAIRKANNLRSDELAIGQVLIIPNK
ncbi:MULTISPECIES: LysM peptidoglycan-binding domain-containing protein [Vibrio]|uniref:LysM peptidoglycan-binding domain-containing protein n=1 Tax=Vibrio TaxID=662 RepID=UPI0001B959E9|nr:MULTISPECIES: LysM peptidoglycan-binding domain-containing protein [Vibrio]EEX35568.1 N-acetylmuramoyl-L-alanine amidase AmiB precursor [Vibrio coralliilyticus ATCC BAA-450]MCM5511559.1 N-acetylmuramoyl-L-alanine amidase [Vibrio sp. SCSIO 43169]MDE3900848.1 N-acetylmuramoyl-L-alanine amidase [Vibrio sp. CC007]QFT37747.1 N-acetylmuramoyl-L-alanine amidase AmiB precursor [Vibrio sp. THAF64]QGM35650.1 N-acetylmuramoyl-L-alanine amidase AmiB precursor [Vibrio sp. THAF191d]